MHTDLPRLPLPRARAARLLLLAAALVGCGDAANARPRADVRGRSGSVVELPAARRADAYTAALRTSFDLNASLLLVVDPAKLPAEGGYAREDSLPGELVAALVRSGTMRGSCVPHRGVPERAPRCDVSTAGYAVRASDLFRAEGDTVRLFLAVERVQPAADSSFVKAFAFEGRYLLVDRDGTWVVVRAGRRMIS